MPQDLQNIPPNAEVWRVGNTYWVVYHVPNTNPPVPMGWRVPPSEVAALGISGQDRVLSSADFWRTGVLDMGITTEIPRTEQGVHPFDVMVREYETEALVKPWLKDPEILALWAGAAMEGRSMTPAELQGTNWWRTHSEEERAWISLNASDPTTAADRIADNRLRVMTIFEQMGVDNASAALINAVADQWTRGSWTEAYAMSQIQGLADPYSRVARDPSLTRLARDLDVTRGRELEVRNLVDRWLGPAYSQGWNANTIAQWAGEFRNNPDAETELTEILRGQRMALFPEYTNPNLTYEDIAAPWRGVWQSIWGETPDEFNSLFTSIVRMNDLNGAEQLLRTEGLRQNNPEVGESMVADLNQAFGGNVRRIEK